MRKVSSQMVVCRVGRYRFSRSIQYKDEIYPTVLLSHFIITKNVHNHPLKEEIDFKF